MEETSATEVPQTQYTVIRTAARVRFYPLLVKKLRKRGPLSGGTYKCTVMALLTNSMYIYTVESVKVLNDGSLVSDISPWSYCSYNEFCSITKWFNCNIYYAMLHKNVNHLNCTLYMHVAS